MEVTITYSDEAISIRCLAEIYDIVLAYIRQQSLGYRCIARAVDEPNPDRFLEDKPLLLLLLMMMIQGRRSPCIIVRALGGVLLILESPGKFFLF